MTIHGRAFSFSRKGTTASYTSKDKGPARRSSRWLLRYSHCTNVDRDAQASNEAIFIHDLALRALSRPWSGINDSTRSGCEAPYLYPFPNDDRHQVLAHLH